MARSDVRAASSYVHGRGAAERPERSAVAACSGGRARHGEGRRVAAGSPDIAATCRFDRSSQAHAGGGFGVHRSSAMSSTGPPLFQGRGSRGCIVWRSLAADHRRTRLAIRPTRLPSVVVEPGWCPNVHGPGSRSRCPTGALHVVQRSCSWAVVPPTDELLESMPIWGDFDLPVILRPTNDHPATSARTDLPLQVASGGGRGTLGISWDRRVRPHIRRHVDATMAIHGSRDNPSRQPWHHRASAQDTARAGVELCTTP